MTDNVNQVQELIQRAKRGEDGAIGTLVETVRTYLLMVANQELEPGLRPKVAASDLVQEACLVATRSFGDFRGTSEGELRAWLRQVLLNSLSDSRKRFHQSQKRRLSREVVLDGDVGVPAAEISPRTSMIAREESDKLLAAMARLPEDYRMVLELRNWELLSFEDIGQQIDRSADAAQKLWTRAVKRLEEELGGGDS